MAVSPDCSLLATASADKTVFLFKAANATTYSPVGYFKLEQEPTCLTWHSSSTKLLIGCR